jgi:hypothetical protein
MFKNKLINLFLIAVISLASFGFTRDYDTSIPINHSLNSLWPSYDRAVKVDIQDRLIDIVSGFDSGETTVGILNLPFIANSAPGTVTNQIQLYGKDSSGKTELFVKDEDGDEFQITKDAKLYGGSLGSLTNNVYLTAVNNAGSGTDNLIKANTSDQMEVGVAMLANGGVIIPEIVAPATAANQGAIYTKNDGDQTELYFREESSGDEVQITNAGAVNITVPALGAWVDKSSNYGNQQATTDGFVVGYFRASGTADITGYTDSNNPTTTTRQAQTFTTGQYGNLMFPVKKNDYWKVTVSSTDINTVYWIPLSQ